MNHPNATASFVTTTIAGALLHVANHYHWVSFSATDSLAAAGAAVTAVLFIGRRGIGPTLAGLWRGVATGVSGPTSKVKAPPLSDVAAIAEAAIEKAVDPPPPPPTPSPTLDAVAGPGAPDPAPASPAEATA